MENLEQWLNSQLRRCNAKADSSAWDDGYLVAIEQVLSMHKRFEERQTHNPHCGRCGKVVELDTWLKAFLNAANREIDSGEV